MSVKKRKSKKAASQKKMSRRSILKTADVLIELAHAAHTTEQIHTDSAAFAELCGAAMALLSLVSARLKISALDRALKEFDKAATEERLNKAKWSL